MHLPYLFTGVLCACSLNAALVSSVITPVGSNYSCEYTVVNDEALPIIGLQLLIPVEPVSVSAAPGWISNSAESFDSFFLLQWFSDQDVIRPVEIAPGKSASGFVVVTPTALPHVSFSTLDTDLGMFTGATRDPAPVPEPGTVAGGLAAAAAWLMRRMRRSA
jgi:hypothetical protein